MNKIQIFAYSFLKYKVKNISCQSKFQNNYLIQIELVKYQKKYKMNVFMSLIWISVTLIAIMFIEIYTQILLVNDTFYSKALPQTKCLSLQQQKKLCVHCINIKNLQKDRLLTSNIQFISTIISDNRIPIAYNSTGLKALNVGLKNDLFCEQYLQFVDLDKLKENPFKRNVALESGQASQKILRLIQAQSMEIQNIEIKEGQQIFQLSSLGVQQHIIYEIITTSSSKQPLMVIKYFSKSSLIKVLNFSLNFAVFLYLIVGCIILYLEIKKNGKLQSYTTIALNSILLYAVLYTHIKITPDNPFLQPLAWTLFIWICLAKVDNIDFDQFKYTLRTKLILSILSGISCYMTRTTGNRLYSGVYYLVLGVYIIYYKVLYRLKLNNSFRVQIINSLVYVCVALTFLIESLIVEHFYSFRFIRQIQILRYGILIFPPIVMLVVIYNENLIQVQNFQEYMEVQGTHMNMEEHQMTEQKQITKSISA